VLRSGRIVAEVSRDLAEQDILLTYMTGLEPPRSGDAPSSGAALGLVG
jgi:hypothetical protein